MATFEIPLNAFPESFSMTLSGVDYNAITRWNAQLSVWVLSLLTTEDVPVVSNIPLIPGVDLLEPYTTLGFVGALYAVVDHDAAAAPSFDNLGGTGHLYYQGP